MTQATSVVYLDSGETTYIVTSGEQGPPGAAGADNTATEIVGMEFFADGDAEFEHRNGDITHFPVTGTLDTGTF